MCNSNQFLAFLHLTIHAQDASTKYPDINDFFPKFDNSAKLNVTINMDIKKIDVDQLMKKMEAFQSNIPDDQQLLETRRQSLMYNSKKKKWYVKASEHMTKQKAADLMLQLIYMARHILKQMEDDPNFSNKDTGYRIGYLGVKLKKMHDLVKTIFSQMHAKNYVYEIVLHHLKLHMRSAKIHVDFVYLWWVMVKLDAKYRKVTNKEQDLPKRNKKTAGFSNERVA